MSEPARQLRNIGESEWQTRIDLAACYRLVALEGWTDLTATHISARLPEEPDCFLLNPHGLLFEEITASSLVKIHLDGTVLDDGPYGINEAGYTIHSAILGAREDVGTALHTHTPAGMAVAAMECGLLPISQHAMLFYDRLAYHDYEGIALDEDEGPRLVRDLGERNAMILRNHGLLTVGRSAGDAFTTMYYLEKCCQSQIAAMQSGAELVVPPAEVCEHAARQYEGFPDMGQHNWPALLRRLDRVNPGYRD